MQRADIFCARPTHLGPVSQRIWTPLDLDPDSGYGPPPPLRGFGPRNKTE